MIILTIRTDKKISEVGVFKKNKKLMYLKWLAHRDLSKTILLMIEKILVQVGVDKKEIKAIVFYKGPGSFTGLRIGATVANTLAYSIPAKIVSLSGKNWIKEGIAKILQGKNEIKAQIDYGAKANITKPRK
jgi:tRNA threonylcarbamoyladenosine biosynthesis protein TsaB